jgi:TusA-related sulfurtransferase
MNQGFPAPAEQTDLDYFLSELDKANKKLDYTIEFLETLEALTTDPATAGRIRSFLVKEGVWPSQQKN